MASRRSATSCFYGRAPERTDCRNNTSASWKTSSSYRSERQYLTGRGASLSCRDRIFLSDQRQMAPLPAIRIILDNPVSKASDQRHASPLNACRAGSYRRPPGFRGSASLTANRSGCADFQRTSWEGAYGVNANGNDRRGMADLVRSYRPATGSSICSDGRPDHHRARAGATRSPLDQSPRSAV